MIWKIQSVDISPTMLVALTAICKKRNNGFDKESGFSNPLVENIMIIYLKGSDFFHQFPIVYYARQNFDVTLLCSLIFLGSVSILYILLYCPLLFSNVLDLIMSGSNKGYRSCSPCHHFHPLQEVPKGPGPPPVMGVFTWLLPSGEGTLFVLKGVFMYTIQLILRHYTKIAARVNRREVYPQGPKSTPRGELVKTPSRVTQVQCYQMP
jgi:hypothetical protein